MGTLINKMKENFKIVPAPYGEQYKFDKISVADRDSQLMSDFNKYLEDELNGKLGDKEIIFNKLFREQGVTYQESPLAAFKCLQHDKIVVLPYIDLGPVALGSPHSSIVHVEMNDQSDETEQFEVAFNWLTKNGKDKTLHNFFGSLLHPTVKHKITKTYNVFSVESDGSKNLEKSFDFKRIAEEFADDYAVNNDVDVIVASVEEQLRSPKRDNLNRLRIEFSKLNKSLFSQVGFIVVGEGISNN